MQIIAPGNRVVHAVLGALLHLPSRRFVPDTPSVTVDDPTSAEQASAQLTRTGEQMYRHTKLPDPFALPWLFRGVTGLRYFGRAIVLLYRDHPLRRVSRWLIGLNVFLYLGPVATLALVAFEFAHLVHPENSLVQSSPLLAEVVAAGTKAVVVAISFGVATVGLFLSVVVGKILTSPLVDAISERTEARFFERKKPLWHILLSVLSSVKEFGVQMLLLCVHVPVLLTLFAVAHVTVFGPIVALTLGYMWAALWISLSVLSNVAARHGCGGFARLSLVVRQAPLFLGFAGIAAAAPALLMPLALPALTAGATELYMAIALKGGAPHTLSVDEVKSALDGGVAVVDDDVSVPPDEPTPR